MGYPFGQDIRFKFYPLADGVEATDIPNDNPSIYVFADNAKPSRTNGLSGTGAQQGPITSWTRITNENGFVFTITAIQDPDVGGGADKRVYWVAINFRLKTSGQYQTVIKALELERVGAHQKQFYVRVADIINYFPQVEDYFNPFQVQAVSDRVRIEIVSYMTQRGFDWSLVVRPDRLQLAATFRVMQRLAESQRRQAGDSWDVNQAQWEKTYNELIKSLKIEYDAENQGQATEVKKAGGYAVVMR